jgi:heavy metal sensor kinase
LLFAVLVALVLLGTGVFVHIRFSQDLRQAVDAGLSSRAQELLSGIDDSGIQFGDEGNLIEPDAAFTQIVSADGNVIESSPALGQRLLLPKSAIAQVDRATFFNAAVTASNEPLKARLLAVPSDDGFIVIVGASLEKQDEAANKLVGALLLGGSAALAITTFIGWLVAGTALRPVERLRAEAAEISGDRPGRRLKIPETGDELARLGETLNDMLARLEQAIEHERRFVDDASHELRTPLGILKTELELALRKARSPEELQQALRSAAQESDRLNSLAEDLLVLARSDRGRLPVHRQDTDVLALIDSVMSRFRLTAEARGIELRTHVPTGLRAHVDPTRIQQAIGNLVDNALRHSHLGGSVEVRVDQASERLRIAVVDEGSGFPDGSVDRIFEPFTRIDAGRARSSGGAGLGLAIVKAIVESHGGMVVAANMAHGAVVTIEIPN